MKPFSLISFVVLVFVFGVARAQSTSFTIQEVGSFLFQATSIDTNGDGATASTIIEEGTSQQLGTVFTKAVLESYGSYSLSTCPNGNIGFRAPLVGGSFILRRALTNALILGRLTSGTSCYDSSTKTFFGTVNGSINGGTGQYATATGSFTATFKAKVTFGDPTQGQAFGASVTKITGTINQ